MAILLALSTNALQGNLFIIIIIIIIIIKIMLTRAVNPDRATL